MVLRGVVLRGVVRSGEVDVLAILLGWVSASQARRVFGKPVAARVGGVVLLERLVPLLPTVEARPMESCRPMRCSDLYLRTLDSSVESLRIQVCNSSTFCCFFATSSRREGSFSLEDASLCAWAAMAGT